MSVVRDEVGGVEIHPDGRLVMHPPPFWLAEAEALIGGMDIASCPDRVHVLGVPEYGVLDRAPLNMTAYLCYGRSPIHGVCCLWRDDRLPLADAVLALLHTLGRAVAQGDIDRARTIAVAYWTEARR